MCHNYTPSTSQAFPAALHAAETEPINVSGWLRELNTMCVCERKLMAVRIVESERPGPILDAAAALAWAALVDEVERGLDPTSQANDRRARLSLAPVA